MELPYSNQIMLMGDTHRYVYGRSIAFALAILRESDWAVQMKYARGKASSVKIMASSAITSLIETHLERCRSNQIDGVSIDAISLSDSKARCVLGALR
jgi:hypothetical protein